MPLPRLLLHLFNADSADSGGRPREVLLHERLVQAHRFENLCASVALNGRYAHLGHYLEDSLVRGLYVVVFGCFVVHAGCQKAGLASHTGQCFECQIGVNRACAVADEQGEVRHLTGLASLDNQAHFCTSALPYEVVVNAGCGQDAGNGRMHGINTPVRKHQYGVAVP